MVDGWDPATEYSNGIIAMSNMYETLTHYNPVTHQVEPLLATSWSSSADGLTWTFQLRHGVLLPHRPADDRAGGQGGHPAHQASWAAAPPTSGARSRRIDTPSQYTLVFHLTYPSPLDLGGVGRLLGLHLRHPGGWRGRQPDQVAEHPARRGHRPVHAADLEQAARSSRSSSRPSPKYWGGWSGLALHEGRVPGRRRRTPPRRSCCGPARSASSSRSARRCGSRSRAHPGIRRSAPRPGRTCWPSSTPGAEPADAAGHLRTASTTRASSRRCSGAAVAVQRHRPGRPARPLHQPAELHLRPGQGSAAAELGRVRAGQEAAEPDA